jgi:Na+-driven multidrug efflux pump
LLRTVSIAMPALALIMILTGALRGAGDTRWPLLFSIVGLLGVRIPAAYWFAFPQVHVPVLHLVISGWGLGVLGTWYAMVSDLGLRASLILYRFSQGDWKRIRV